MRIYVCALHLCVYACMYICMDVCIHVCMYVIFKLDFERYRGNCSSWEGELSGNCPGVNCPEELIVRVEMSVPLYTESLLSWISMNDN